MYAIVEDGSRQYRVEAGAMVTLDYRDAEAGQRLELGKVLLLSSGADTTIGQPLVAGARVLAEVIDFPKTKTMTQKFRRRKNYRRLKGHTQPYVRVKVTHILGAGEPTPAETPKPAPTETPTPAPTPAV
jgi:large subunit ribosomal protein L21